MLDATAKDIETVITSLAVKVDGDLQSKTEAELEEYWFFQWDDSLSIEWNLYQFHDLLDLYKRQCQRWEEYHNGMCCVVERVRDKYLMPKICAFIEQMKDVPQNSQNLSTEKKYD